MTAELIATVATGLVLVGTVWLTFLLIEHPLPGAQALAEKKPRRGSRGRRVAS